MNGVEYVYVVMKNREPIFASPDPAKAGEFAVARMHEEARQVEFEALINPAMFWICMTRWVGK